MGMAPGACIYTLAPVHSITYQHLGERGHFHASPTGGAVVSVTKSVDLLKSWNYELTYSY